MACEADCKIRKRKKGKVTGEVTPDAKNPNPPFEKYPKPADYDAALQKKIDDWMADKELQPKCSSGCKCEATEDPDWTNKKVHTRDFEMSFPANGFQWTVTATVEFQSAIVPGDCIEVPGKPIKLAYAATIPDLGVTLLSDSREITSETIEKVRKALG